jgi:hypothetical protein
VSRRSSSRASPGASWWAERRGRPIAARWPRPVTEGLTAAPIRAKAPAAQHGHVDLGIAGVGRHGADLTSLGGDKAAAAGHPVRGGAPGRRRRGPERPVLSPAAPGAGVIPAEPGHDLPETRGVDALGPPGGDIDIVRQARGVTLAIRPCACGDSGRRCQRCTQGSTRSSPAGSSVTVFRVSAD